MARNLCGISIFDERLSTPEESAGTESDGHLKYTLYTQSLENHNCRFWVRVCSPGVVILLHKKYIGFQQYRVLFELKRTKYY